MQRIEVTQAIQEETANSATLVRGRETIVRVYVNATTPDGSPVDNIDGRLTINGITERSVGSINEPITAGDDSDANLANHTLNFCFIPGASTVALEVELDHRNRIAESDESNNTQSRVISIDCEAEYDIRAFRINYIDRGLPDRDLVGPGSGEDFIVAGFPLSSLRYTLQGRINWDTTLTRDNGGELLGRLWETRVNPFRLRKPDFTYAWVEGSLPFNGMSSTIGGFPVGYGNSEPDRFQRTFAHELGHQLGPDHDNSNIAWYGVDTFNLLGLGQIKDTSLVQLMAPGRLTDEAWVDLDEWEDFYSALTECETPSKPELGAINGMVVTGLYDNDAGTASLDIVYGGANVLGTPDDPFGKLILRQLQGGTVISERRFDPGDCEVDDVSDPDCVAPFGIVAPFDGRVDRVQIVDAVSGMVLTQRFKTPTAAIPTFIGIGNGAVLVEGQTIDVDAFDPDPSPTPRLFQVDWSADGGMTWTAVTLYTEETSFVVPDDLPGSAGNGWMRLRVTDGFNLGEALLVDLSLTTVDQLPTVTVVAPDSGLAIPEEAGFHLRGTASDAEDGDLGPVINWSSSLDGPLGTGAAVEVNDLSVGVHEICASVMDSAGQPAEDCVTLVVTERDLGEPLLLNEVAITEVDPVDRLEFIELAGPPGLPLGGVSALIIIGSPTGDGPGVVSRVDTIEAGTAMPGDGLFVLGDTGVENLDRVFQGPPGTHSIPNTSFTLLLMEGTAPNQIAQLVGQDLDLDDDGVLDPILDSFGTIIDAISVDSGAAGSLHYASPVVGPKSVSGVSRIPAGVFRVDDADFSIAVNRDPGTPLGSPSTPGMPNNPPADEAGWYNGLLHVAFGGGEFLNANGFRIAAGGQSGDEGVRIYSADAQYVQPDIRVPRADAVPDGAMFELRSFGAEFAGDSEYDTSVKMTATVNGWDLDVDLTPLGGQQASLRLFNEDDLVIEVPWDIDINGPGPFLSWFNPICDMGPVPCAADHLTRLEFDGDITVRIDGNDYIADRLDIRVDDATNLPPAVRRTDILTQGVDLTIDGIGVGVLGSEIRAIERPHMQAVAADFAEISDLESNLFEGVAVHPSTFINNGVGPASTTTAQVDFQPIAPADVADGDAIRLAPIVDENADREYLVTRTGPDASPTWRVTAPLGVGGTEVTAFFDGAEVGSAIAVGNAELARFAGAIGTAIANAGPAAPASLRLETESSSILILPDGTSVTADAVEFAPASALQGNVTALELAFKAMRLVDEFPAVVLTGAAFGTDGGPCNAADIAEPFGVLDLSDVARFIEAFVGMEPPADLNGDGLFDLTDLALFIEAFTSGCP